MPRQAKRGRPRKRDKKPVPAHWVPCTTVNCPNFCSPENESQTCAGCRGSAAYHLRQGSTHCFLYAKKCEKLMDRAKKFNITAGIKTRRAS